MEAGPAPISGPTDNYIGAGPRITLCYTLGHGVWGFTYLYTRLRINIDYLPIQPRTHLCS